MIVLPVTVAVIMPRCTVLFVNVSESVTSWIIWKVVIPLRGGVVVEIPVMILGWVVPGAITVRMTGIIEWLVVVISAVCTMNKCATVKGSVILSFLEFVRASSSTTRVLALGKIISESSTFFSAVVSSCVRFLVCLRVF